MTMPTVRLGPEYLVLATLKAAILLFAGFAVLAATSSAELGWRGSSVIVATAALISLIAHRASNGLRSIALDAVGWATLAVLAAAGFFWALAYDAAQPSDFGIYFECGAHALDPKYCASRYVDLGSVYVDRSRFYTALLGLAFPGNYTALKVFNAVLHAAALTGTWVLLRRHLGGAAALLGLVLYGLNPEGLYSISLATPDNLSQVLIVALFGLTAQARPTRTWLTAILLGVAIYLVDQIRSIGPFAFVAVVVWTLAGSRGEFGRAVSRLAVTAAIYALAGLATRLWNSLPPPDLFWPAVTGLNVSDPRNSPSYPWVAHLWPAVPVAERFAAGATKIALELSQGLDEWVELVRFKAGVLSSGLGAAWFATADLSSNLDTVQTISKPNVPQLPWSGMGRAANLLTMCLAAFGAMRVSVRMFGLVPLAFVACAAGYLVTVGETQPRYVFIILPGLVTLAATSLAPKDGYRTDVFQSLVGLLILSVVLVGLQASARVLTSGVTRPLGPVAADPARQAECGIPSVESEPGGAHIRVAPGDQCGGVAFDLPRTTASVSFFVTRDDFPYPLLPIVKPELHYKVRDGERVLYEGTLTGRETVRWHRFDLRPAPGQSPHLTITFGRISPGDAALHAGIAHIVGR